MNPKLEELLFQLALTKTVAERSVWLDRECGGDSALRQRLEALLAARAEPAPLPTTQIEAVPGALAAERAAALSDEAVGQMLGRYKLVEKLGEGGFGAVWLAEQREPVRRKIALKIIKLGMDTQQVVARFDAERQALAMMDHPNIAKVLDAGTTGVGRPYFVMELVRGIKITEYCDQAKLSTRDRLDLFIKVCHAIQHAHQKGIIHRDIKPTNILVTLHDGVPVPKVIDFGIAKATQGELTDKTIHTQFQQFIGTPAYMSPEQAEMSGLDIDTRSDIYSLGVLLYELLAGSTPFDSQELMSQGIDAMRKTIREKEPVRPSTRLATLKGDDLTTTAKRRSADTSKLLHQLKGDLDWIVMKCLEKDRQRRYDTANGLAADLKRHLDNEPVLARPPSPLYRLQKMVRRNKAASVATASIVMALAIGIGLAMAALVQKNAAKQQALDQSVRADTVTTFIDALLTDTLPELLRQGNSQGARALINTADRLATSSLSTTPAAEVELRWRLFRILFFELNDPQAYMRQAELISGLLSKVAADPIKVPREQLRIAVSTACLWAADPRGFAMEKPLQELDALSAEFMGRTPPAKDWAAFCRFHQGLYLTVFRKLEPAEEKLAAAYELLPKDMQEPARERWDIPAYYVRVLADLGKLARAEEAARGTPKLPPRAEAEARTAFLGFVYEWINILCLQDRFGEALRMLEEQRQVLADSGGSETDLLRVDAMRGAVLARSGNAGEALKELAKVAAHRLSNADDVFNAALLAVVTGDYENYRELCRLALLRFASTAQGKAASIIARTLLLSPSDEMTLSLTRGMVERVAGAQDWSRELASLQESMLALRAHRYPESLSLLDKYAGGANDGVYRVYWDASPAGQAMVRFTRALLCAELERADEARRQLAQGRAQLKLALGEKPGHDRGRDWRSSFEAECLRREAEVVFKTKGIPLPEPDTQ